MQNNRLNESTIGSARVIIDILPKGKVIPNTKITPTSITIHNTGNIGAPAKNNHNYMKNCNKDGSRIASWHFTVDDKEIYQAQSTNYKCYHAGTSAGNNSSIGIEICMFDDEERQRKTYENAIELVKILMKYHGFGIDKVKRHKDWSGKQCPAWLISGKFGYTWDWFKAQCTNKTNSNPVQKPITGTPSNAFVVKVIYKGKEGLNVRQQPTTSSRVTGIIYCNQAYTIVEVRGSWGRLKSGLGWISLSEKYVKRV